MNQHNWPDVLCASGTRAEGSSRGSLRGSLRFIIWEPWKGFTVTFSLLPLLHPVINSSPPIPSSHKNILHLYTISSIHSSSHRLPPVLTTPLFLSSCVLSFIDWTWRLSGVRFPSLKLPDVSSWALLFNRCRKHAALQAESHAWHHPPRRLSKLSPTPQILSL